MKVLLTSTSFQDTPGRHQDLLEGTGWEVVKMRGPLKEEELLEVIDTIDIVICGDDEYTREVIKKGSEAQLKGISKYGVGLDAVDLDAAKEFNIPVKNCPGVNQNAVAEHVFGLLLSYFRNISEQVETVQQYKWDRLVGSEVSDKKLGVYGLGSVGKEVAKKARAWGMEVYGVDKYVDEEFTSSHGIHIMDTIEELVSQVDILSLNAPLNPETEGIISEDVIQNHAKEGLTIVNTARGKLVDTNAIINGIKSKKLRGYLADVLEQEPIIEDHPFVGVKGIIITPHIGSRTFESVQKQGIFAIKNAQSILENI